MEPTRYNFYLKNDSSIRLIHVALAKEIGFNESVVLLQIDHLVNLDNNNKVYDGRYWTFDSIKSLRDKYFPFWGTTTLKKAISNLESKKLIIKANYNKAGFDKTNWYTINYDEAANLNSIIIGYEDEGGCNQPLVKKCPTKGQNVSNDEPESDHPIPETSTKTSSKTSTDTCSPQDNVTPVGKKDVGCNVNQDIKKILDQREYENLKTTKNKNIGNITSYNRNMERKGITLGKDEIYTALYLYNSLDCKEHPLLCEYIEHESKLWDFSKTKNPQAVTAQFILECLYNSDTFLHFCKLRKNGDLQEELRYYKCELENSDEDKPLIDLWRES